MKKIMTFAAAAAFAVCFMSSCATVNSGAAIGEKGAIGQKLGEAKSTYYLWGLWSSQGEKNNLQEAAKNGGISKVAQVEYIDKSIFFGLIIQHTTRVYGESTLKGEK